MLACEHRAEQGGNRVLQPEVEEVLYAHPDADRVVENVKKVVIRAGVELEVR